MTQFALYFGSFGGNGERQLVALAIFCFKMTLLTRGFGLAFAMALLSIKCLAFTPARQNKQKQARKTNKRNQAGKTQRANASKFSQTKRAKQ